MCVGGGKPIPHPHLPVTMPGFRCANHQNRVAGAVAAAAAAAAATAAATAVIVVVVEVVEEEQEQEPDQIENRAATAE